MNKSLNNAKKAILQEMKMFPCLGLVSRWDTGSHHDMNYKTFKKSYRVLGGLLTEIYHQQTTINDFQALKKLGYEYELLMFQKTKNINTHKGLLFHLSIFWYSFLKTNNQQELQKFIENFCQDLKLTDSEPIKVSGEILYQGQEVFGARFIALEGYQVVFEVYNFYLDNLKNQKMSKKIKNFALLLKMVSLIDDTTAIKKIGLKTYREFQQEINNLLTQILEQPNDSKTWTAIMNFNKKAIDAKFSPGGAADLLVLVFFLIDENY